MKHTRFRLGFLWKEGLAKGDFQKYYDEFSQEIQVESDKNDASVDKKIMEADKAFIESKIKVLEVTKE